MKFFGTPTIERGMNSPTIERSEQFNYGTVIVPPHGSGLSKKELEYEEATRRLLGPGASVGGMHHHDMHLMSYIDRHNYATMRMFYLVLFALCMMIVYASLVIAWKVDGEASCGTDYDSAYFETYLDDSGEYRILEGNYCPGYDWSYQSTPAYAGSKDFKYSIPATPVNCTSPTYVDSYGGHIGFALNGVPIFAPYDEEGRDAIDYEYDSFDHCGGHVKDKTSVINTLVFWEHPPGRYHYHSMPGDRYPDDHSDDANLDFDLCSDVTEWYTEADSDHSPIIGFMIDGYAIYGPQGADGDVPTDLDECGGHATDLGFYHYHFSSLFPYSVACLWGQMDGSVNHKIRNSADCDVSDIQWSYTNDDSLGDYSLSYGSDENASKTYFSIVLLLLMTTLTLIYALKECWLFIMREKRLLDSNRGGFRANARGGITSLTPVVSGIPVGH